MKKILIPIVALIIMVGASMTVFAAPQTMKDGAIFDAQDYADRYPDLKKVYGYNADILYPHYLLVGAEEGRTAIYTPAPVKSNTSSNNVAKNNKFDKPLNVWMQSVSSQGYPIFICYSTYNNVGDIIWKANAKYTTDGRPISESVAKEAGIPGYGAVWETCANPYGNVGLHFVYPTEKVGKYAEGVIYKCVAGCHYTKFGYNDDIGFYGGTCQPGTYSE